MRRRTSGTKRSVDTSDERPASGAGSDRWEDGMARLLVRVSASVAGFVAVVAAGSAWWKY
jgi:hypothetical protein